MSLPFRLTMERGIDKAREMITIPLRRCTTAICPPRVVRSAPIRFGFDTEQAGLARLGLLEHRSTERYPRRDPALGEVTSLGQGLTWPRRTNAAPTGGADQRRWPRRRPGRDLSRPGCLAPRS